MKLSDFGLCKPLDCSNLQEKDLSVGVNRSGVLQSDGRPLPPKRSQQQQLEHWQKNRSRMLVSLSINVFINKHNYFIPYEPVSTLNTLFQSLCFYHVWTLVPLRYTTFVIASMQLRPQKMLLFGFVPQLCMYNIQQQQQPSLIPLSGVGYVELESIGLVVSQLTLGGFLNNLDESY